MELVGGGSVINGATPVQQLCGVLQCLCSVALWSVELFLFSSSVKCCSVSVQQLC